MRDANARTAILSKVRAALAHAPRPAKPALPALPHLPGDADAQIAAALQAIEQVGGRTRQVRGRDDLRAALEELVHVETVRRATLWQTRELRELGVAEMLARLGVELVPPSAGTRELAACDLGITGADAVLAQTGTLALRATTEQSELTSLLPRVHLAIFRAAALRADWYALLAPFTRAKHLTLITGPSRTADIEKVLAIGVHGPKVFYAWSYAE